MSDNSSMEERIRSEYLEKKAGFVTRNVSYAASGVVFVDIESAYIEEGIAIGEGTEIGSCVTIKGKTVIGKNCVIEAGTVIVDSIIADECSVEQGCRITGAEVATGARILLSVLLECTVGERTTVGPYAYLRPGSHVGSNVRIGDFVEVKNSSIGDGTKVSHLTYVGDSDLGSNVILGCGVVFVNYDGKNKFRSKVENGAFIGCNVNLVSPVNVGEKAFVAAGTTVTKDVPAKSLTIGRNKQLVKENWAKKNGLVD